MKNIIIIMLSTAFLLAGCYTHVGYQTTDRTDRVESRSNVHVTTLSHWTPGAYYYYDPFLYSHVRVHFHRSFYRYHNVSVFRGHTFYYHYATPRPIYVRNVRNRNVARRGYTTGRGTYNTIRNQHRQRTRSQAPRTTQRGTHVRSNRGNATQRNNRNVRQRGREAVRSRGRSDTRVDRRNNVRTEQRTQQRQRQRTTRNRGAERTRGSETRDRRDRRSRGNND